MNKTEFFAKLDSKLSKKYGIAPEYVKYIRSRVLGQILTKEEVIVKLNEQLNNKVRMIGQYKVALKMKPTNSEMLNGVKIMTKRIKQFPKVISFLENCSVKEWKDIIQRTKFDKQ